MNPISLISSTLITLAILTMPCHSFPKKNTSVVFEPGPWKPLKSTSTPFTTLPLVPSAILNRRGFLNPSATELSSQSFQYARPGTLIKNREGSSSTFGLDIPDSNLRLLLDIDELSAKPTHDNFKLKVIERDESMRPTRNGNNNKYSVPLRPPVPLAQPPVVSSPSSFATNSQKYQIGYIRTTDLHTALNSGALPPGSKAYPVPQAVKFSQPMRDAANMVDKMKSEKNLLLNPSNSLDSQPFVPMSHMKPSSSASAQALPLTSAPVLASELEPSAQTFSKTNSRPNKPAAAPATVSSPVKSLRKSRKMKSKGSSEKRNQRLVDTTTTSTTTASTTTTTEPTTTTVEVPSSSRASSEKPSFRVSDDLRFEEQQKQTEVPDEDVQIQSNNAQIKDVVNQQQQDQEREEIAEVKQNQQQQQQQEEEVQQQQVRTTKTPETAAVKTIPGNNQSIGRLRNANSIESEESDDSSSSRGNSSENDDSENSDDFDDGFDLLRSNPLSNSQSATCSPKVGTSGKISADLESMTLKDYARSLNADALFNKLPGSEEMLQSMLDFANSGYTLFLPSSEAVNRLPKQLIRRLKEDKEELRKLIENHVSEDKRQMSTGMAAMTMSSRVTSGRLRINRAASDAVLVNGNRILNMNNRGPAGGSVHVIDGLLYPVADKNLMETMKSCNRFDGFVTLAEGTGLGETLSSGGPYTVFVPSNEALQKIPDVDLERIRNNMTALKEFLMFHVAQGSFYSHDLRDGQFIPSLIPDQDIQVGVRVDGCNRRLVEANVSPLYRADIPASNGVIHVIDWILKPNDRDWCEGTVLPRRR